MFWIGLAIGVLSAGTLMYYIQPAVKDIVAEMFLGAPGLLKRAEEFKARADALVDAAKRL